MRTAATAKTPTKSTAMPTARAIGLPRSRRLSFDAIDQRVEHVGDEEREEHRRQTPRAGCRAANPMAMETPSHRTQRGTLSRSDIRAFYHSHQACRLKQAVAMPSRRRDDSVASMKRVVTGSWYPLASFNSGFPCR